MENLWEQSLPLVQSAMKETTFERWVRPIRFDRIDGDTVVLQVPNTFFRDYLQEGFIDLFREKMFELTQSRYQIVLKVPQDEGPLEPQNGDERPGDAPTPVPVVGARLNPRYVFENFVVGKSNNFAYAACRAVAENPQRNDYNPLFIFGRVGLGKTHLAHAVGHQILRKYPRTRVIYVSSENFTNEVVTSIQHHRMEEFKRKYRNQCDVLLIDDIQFIAGKETTQEEFFHTFEELHHQGKQIVVTSDKPAREIAGLEERLKSRLDWGLPVDIQPPELETKVAILKRMAETQRFFLPDDVAHFLASYCGNNMRELEGSLKRLMAYSNMQSRPVSIDSAQELFEHAVAERSRKPSIEIIVKTVAEQFNVKVADLKGARKHKVIALPRQIAMYLCRQHTGSSFPEIGEKFGGKDHSTVIYACDKIGQLLQQDLTLRHRVQAIERSLGLTS